MNPKQQGRDAYHNGGELNDNPYPVNSTESAEWEEGWYDAEDDEDGDYEE